MKESPKCCCKGELAIEWTMSGWAIMPDVVHGWTMFPCWLNYCPWCGKALEERVSVMQAIANNPEKYGTAGKLDDVLKDLNENPT
jgi:hypothetical protein